MTGKCERRGSVGQRNTACARVPGWGKVCQIQELVRFVQGRFVQGHKARRQQNWHLVPKLLIQRPGVKAFIIQPGLQKTLKTSNRPINQSTTHPSTSHCSIFLATKSEAWLEPGRADIAGKEDFYERQEKVRVL